MNESEKLLKAKSYLDKLANGINPITNELASENDTINNTIHIKSFYMTAMPAIILDNIDTIAYYNTQKKSYNFNTDGNI